MSIIEWISNQNFLLLQFILVFALALSSGAYPISAIKDNLNSWLTMLIKSFFLSSSPLNSEISIMTPEKAKKPRAGRMYSPMLLPAGMMIMEAHDLMRFIIRADRYSRLLNSHWNAPLKTIRNLKKDFFKVHSFFRVKPKQFFRTGWKMQFPGRTMNLQVPIMAASSLNGRLILPVLLSLRSR